MMCDNMLFDDSENEEYTEGDLFLDNYTHPVKGIVYTTCNIPGIGANVEDFETWYAEGCSCRDGICISDTICHCIHLYHRNYNERGYLLPDKFVGSIMECNSSCLCILDPSKCGNRITQFGPSRGLEVFSTSSGKGLGLRTTMKLPFGAFICEYAGEVIGLEEAKLRAQSLQDKDMNYVFVLKEHLADGNVLKTCVDPTVIGNIGRYINHSCQPNSVIVPVRVNTLIPKIAIFASTVIEVGEEITYNYGGGRADDSIGTSNKLCLCGSNNCRKYLPFDSTLY